MRAWFGISLLLITITQIRGQCNFESSWTGQWWIKHWTGTGEVYYNFQNGQVDMVLEDMAGVETVLESRSCIDKFFSSPMWYHLVEIEQENKCFEVFKTDNVMLLQETMPTNVPVEDCTNEIAAITNPKSQVLLKSPISPTTCPFPDGRYQLTYAEGSDADAFCDGDVTSTAVVDGSTLTFSSCSNEDYSYEYPYNVEMSCILGFSPNAIGDDSSNGDVLILSAPGSGAVDMSYCARYKRNSLQKTVTISIGVNNRDETYCIPDATFDTVEDSAFSRFRRFTLTPLYCLEGVCKNGATCEDNLGEYTCTCAPGWTGENCDQDVLECASNPCFNNGVCVEGTNEYTCRCPPTHTGDRCQTLACQIPEEWRTTWWREYASEGNSAILITTFSSNAVTDSETGTEKVWMCENDRDDSSYHHFSLKEEGSNPEIRKCAEGTLVGDNDEVLLYRTSAPEIKSEAYTTAECTAKLGQREEMDVLVDEPFLTLKYTDCPWPNNNVRYQTVYYAAPNAPQCTGDVDSKSIADGRDIDIQSCYNGAVSFRNPLVTKLRCVAHWSATITDDSSGNGDYVLLRYVHPVIGSHHYYCAKYRIVGNQVYLAMDTTSSVDTKCYMNDDYTISSSDQRSFILTSNLCASEPCQNGATCVDKMTATEAFYECECAEGFTGTLCNINIDDCASRPCQNGGTCDDGINSFSCRCTAEFYGDRCQYGACNLPAEIREPKTFMTGYDNNNRQISVSYDKTTRSLTDGESSLCEDQAGGVDGLIGVWEDANNADQRFCTEIWLVDRVLLSRQSDPVFVNERLDTGVCINNLLSPRSTDTVDVALQNPVTSDGNCPFPNTRYKIAVNERPGVLNKCANSDTEVIVSGITMNLDTGNCYAGSSYELPFQNTLQCITTFDSMDLDGMTNSGRGDVVILAYNDNGVTRYYCARYVIQGITVRMSFDTASPNDLQCDASADFSSYSNTERSITLTSNMCGTQPCQNGGVCTDLLADYSCECPEGFTGRNCQTNINECASLPCLNGAICDDGINRYDCRCRTGFSGTNCQTFDECSRSPCRNGGTCRDLQNDYSCSCTAGWTGKDCQQPINECASIPCQNGGTCTDLINGYTCRCEPGFSGIYCQINENECLSQPCQNDGTCLDRVNGYYCRCTPFYIGLHCEQVDECGNEPCRNGGECIDDLGFPHCNCINGYTGDLCELVDNPCDTYFCQNGGTCVSSGADVSCLCATGYYGDVCESTQSPCSENLDPCVNGGTCRVDGTEAVCECPVGWTGVRCSSEEIEGSSLSLTAIILIVVISLLILAVIAVVLALALRKRNRKGDDEASLARSNTNPVITYSAAGSNAWYPAYTNGANGNGSTMPST